MAQNDQETLNLGELQQRDEQESISQIENVYRLASDKNFLNRPWLGSS
jgi:hypothetical protein